MIAFNTPQSALPDLAQLAKERRLEMHLTQAGLAKRSGVKLATLRKFEQTGQISLSSFLKIIFVLDKLNALLKVFTEDDTEYHSIEQMIKAQQRRLKKPKRGKIT